jgi:hypothetical protein
MATAPRHSANIRLVNNDRSGFDQSGVDQSTGLGPVSVMLDDENPPDRPVLDDNGNVIKIEHDDGSVTISLDGQPLETAQDDNPPGWFDNLAEKIDPQVRMQIVDDLLRGIEQDITSRQDWVETNVQGLKLLGLKIELPNTGDSPDGAAMEGQSQVRHPILLEAVLRFQANARAEMLPTDGPAKIRDDNTNPQDQRDQLAEAYEKDFNHFLTVTATEFYPDTDRMFMRLGFGGTTFKKVFNCPLRNRPVSEAVNPEDFIVNNTATDLGNAKRKTHRILMRPSTVKRMQILGAYRDVGLHTPDEPKPDALKEEIRDQEGTSGATPRPEDRDREIYECYCELNVRDFEHKLKGKITGLEVPYRVTIDLSSREMLAMVRNYDQEDEELPIEREVFVDYQFVRGFGFYGIGLLHILGNTANTATAGWRILIDMGMFSNFPGGVISQGAARQNTNLGRVAPGGFIPVQTNGMAIRDAVMALPYSAQGMPALMQLIENVVEQGQRVGSISELPVGEGKQDAPVGTTLALIEQAQKILNSVHKRMHESQSRELQLIAKCFRENPTAFWQSNKRPANQWDEATFLKANEDFQLVPQSDPNTASHVQRLMKLGLLKQLQQAMPTLYDPISVDTTVLQGAGYANPEQFFAAPDKRDQPPPEAQKAMADYEINKQKADNDSQRVQIEAGKAQADTQTKMAELQGKQAESQAKAGEAQQDRMESQMKAQQAQAEMGLKVEEHKANVANMQQEGHLAGAKLQMDQHNSDIENAIRVAEAHLTAALKRKEMADKEQKDLVDERIQLIDVAQTIAVHGPEAGHMVEPLIKPAFEDVQRRQAEMDRKKNEPDEGSQ